MLRTVTKLLLGLKVEIRRTGEDNRTMLVCDDLGELWRDRAVFWESLRGLRYDLPRPQDH
jgi:hypothetical protein